MAPPCLKRINPVLSAFSSSSIPLFFFLQELFGLARCICEKYPITSVVCIDSVGYHLFLFVSVWKKCSVSTTQERHVLFKTNPVSSMPQNGNCSVTYLPSHKQSKQDMLNTAGEEKINSEVTFFYGLLPMDTPVLVVRERLRHISFVQTSDVVYGSCWEWWPMGTDVERKGKSRESVLLAWLNGWLMYVIYSAYLNTTYNAGKYGRIDYMKQIVGTVVKRNKEIPSSSS